MHDATPMLFLDKKAPTAHAQCSNAVDMLEPVETFGHALGCWSDATALHWVQVGRKVDIARTDMFLIFSLKQFLG